MEQDPVQKMAVTDVLAAMKSITSEADQWRLADALAVQVPKGDGGFAEILDEAKSAGVAGKVKSVSSLRLYRDTANRWPTDKRLDYVSFSAHREAMRVGTIAQAVKLLEKLDGQYGRGNVTSSIVRRAVDIQKGNIPATTVATSKTSAKTGTDAPATVNVPAMPSPTELLVAELLAGAPGLIAALDAHLKANPGTDLDKVSTGLNKTLGHVDALRAKAKQKADAAAQKAATAARKATATARTSKPRTAPKTTPKTTAPKAPAAAPKADLRGLV